MKPEVANDELLPCMKTGRTGASMFLCGKAIISRLGLFSGFCHDVIDWND